MLRILVILILCVALLGCVTPPVGPQLVAPASPAEEPRTPCRVLMVFDGDTVGCDLSGDGQIQKPEEHIRLLGIDTPETSHSKRFENDPERAGKDQPYAQQARMFLDSRIKGQTVFLAFDVSRTDRYGRTLAFVYADEATPQSLNETMLKEGYATLLFIAPNRKHYSAFEQAETEARRAQRGLWRP